MHYRLISNAVVLVAGLMFAGPGIANEAAAPALQPQPAAPAAAPVAPVVTQDVANYCRSLVPVMTDARARAEKAELKALGDEITTRMAALEAKRAEVEDWVKRREAFLKQADADKVQIYQKMKPDAAAAQLSVMDDGMSAAILANLPAKSASLILAEIEPARAAQLVTLMSGTAASGPRP